MRSSLHLACVLHFHHPPTASAMALDGSFQHAYEPVLDAMEADERLRLAMHFGGRILEHALAHRPNFLARLERLQRAGRLEVLGGAFFDPVLAAIPERDAIGQLQFAANWLKRQLGVVPEGGWLALRVWDPALPRTLASGGVRYTLLDDSQFLAAGLESEEVHGHFTTERAGQAVAVLPLDNGIMTALALDPIERVRDRLAMINLAHQGQGERVISIACAGETLVTDGRFMELLGVLNTEHHWLKSILPGRAVRSFSTQGRLYLPTGAAPELAEWSRPAGTRAIRRALRDELETKGVWAAVEPFVGRALFDNFLVKYVEANRLHKRMLFASDSVDRLRTVLAERVRTGRSGDSDERARRVLERACDALWRAQSHAAYWHGGALQSGLYNPALRLSTTRQLMAAQRMAERALGDPGKLGWSVERRDHDADGNDEACVLTTEIGAVVHAARGGTLYELDLRGVGIPLQTELSPVEEPYDDAVVGNEVVLVDADDQPGQLSRSDWSTTTNPELARRRVDRIPRGAFQDHFLGPETTLATFAARQFRELGDFADSPFDLARTAGPEGEPRAGLVQVVRQGVVKDVDRTLLLRVDKTFRFECDRPRFVVEHLVSNRSRETASTWHGLEWTLGLPSGVAANVWASTFDGEQERTFALTEGPHDLGLVTWLEIKDVEVGLSIVIQPSEGVHAWWAPITSVYQGEDGWCEVVQGQTLLLHRPLEIWGQEMQALMLTIDLLLN